MSAEVPRNRFRNNDVAIGIGNRFWNACEAHGLAGIVADLEGAELVSKDGHRFLNLSCCSYLDLDRHPKVIQGAVDALTRYGVLDHCIPRSRVQIPALLELEAVLSELFDAQVVTAISANVASTGMLPLIASGHLTGGVRPVMLFDKYCHVSMAASKPVCGDETEVVTIRHHDLEAIESYCRKHASVCYVCDGSDSLGGYAPVAALTALQERYGLHVFYDDSHSLSVVGKRGQGYVRSHVDEIGPRTIIVATLNKAFGTSGAALMMSGRSREELRVIERFSGGMSFSQPMNTAAIGASLASAGLHMSDVLGELQAQLRQNIAKFDELCPTKQVGGEFPIRLIPFDEDTVIEAGQRVYRAGYYASPVFFPIVPKGQAGLRAMVRAGLSSKDLEGFASAVLDHPVSRRLEGTPC